MRLLLIFHLHTVFVCRQFKIIFHEVLNILEYKFNLRSGCISRTEQQSEYLDIISDENFIFVQDTIETSL